MKVLIFSDTSVFDTIAGSEIQMRTIAGYLLERGHTVVYYFSESVPGRPSREIREGASVYQNERPHGRVLGLMRDTNRLEEIVRKEAPDVLFTRCFDGYLILARVSRRTGVPFVYQIPFALDQGFFDSVSPLKKVRKSVLLSVYYFLARRALKDAAQLLTISCDDADVLEELRGLESKTIYNMHPVPEAQGSKTEPPVVVWINNIKPIKRPELFIDLASRCHDT
ncbi:MAG: glycosyltransferase, partial [Planctomycetota bacterium]